MGAPNVTFTVGPQQQGAVTYLPLAPKFFGAKGAAQLSLYLSITNNENGIALHLEQVNLSFEPPVVNPVSISIEPWDANIPAGQTGVWGFRVDDKKNDNVILPLPAPKSVKVALSFKNFDQPVTVTMPLAAHQSPTPSGSYVFPARASDLSPGEYWSGQSVVHPSGGGQQMFAYDMEVAAWDAEQQNWMLVLPGASNNKNENFRVWGKPIYAIADGTVLQFLNKVPANPKPIPMNSTKEEFQKKFKEQYDNYWGQFEKEGGGAGNHFLIQHGDETVGYAHMQMGTLSEKLLKVGAQVKEGDYLGLAGNSGNSSRPHLHVDAVRSTEPGKGLSQPLPWHGIHVVEFGVLNPNYPYGVWSNVSGQGLPNAWSAIWPDPVPPLPPPPPLSKLPSYFVAIDPLALLLSDKAYVMLTLPDPPPIDVLRARLRKQVGQLTPAEKSWLSAG